MKKLILIIVISLGIYCHAQQLHILTTTSLSNPDSDTNFGENGNYAQDSANERDQYIGTWEYNQNGTLFQVKIEKVDQYLSKWEDNSGNLIRYTYCDVVFFKYKLVKNGVTINDNLNQTSFPAPYPSQAIKKGTEDDLYGSFLDMTNNVVSRVSIKRLNTSPAKITFNFSPGTYYLLNPDDTYDENQPLFTVPLGEIEMVKVN